MYRQPFATNGKEGEQSYLVVVDFMGDMREIFVLRKVEILFLSFSRKINASNDLVIFATRSALAV